MCKAFGIEINPNLKGKGKSIKRYEWEKRRKGASWKEQIRQAIDKLIPTVDTLDELLQALEERGFEIKRVKYISIKAPQQERFVCTKTLGDEYDEESLKARILYREVGAGISAEQDSESKLRAAYVAIIGDVHILAEQRKKVPRKQNVNLPYSADNDLDVYKLSAQLSVINKNYLVSIGEVEARIVRLKNFYDKQRAEINEIIAKHNRLVSLWEQVQEFYALSKKGELSDAEKLRRSVCKQAMERNEILNYADVELLRRRAESLAKCISTMKDSLEKCRQQYDVYCDIRDTYNIISKGEYISNLVEEERQRRNQANKNYN
ncbi:MAG: relaxase/mobilization nuclease domain-containing protein [Ruminococcus sp.]|nr:relaxase/mobilization nuclease domain-containing protein [Ruminococcus sp.]